MSDEENVESAKSHIKDVCNKLGIRIFTNEEYIEYIKKLNKEVNEVFDYNNYTDNYFEDRYHFSKEKATH